MQRFPVVPAVCAVAVAGFLTVATHANSPSTRTIAGNASPAGQSAGNPSSKPKTPAKPALSVRETPLGTVVVGPKGHTLYRSNKDTVNPSASNCIRRCVAIWPPLLGTPASFAVQGVDPKLLGTLRRVDGRTQLTLHGWPLYYFNKDAKPGDVLGEAAGDHVFHPVGPTGQPAGTTNPPSTGGPTSGPTDGPTYAPTDGPTPSSTG
ncbi:MAG TPA: hypothetical protein VMU51_20270 [Mycobacteriales bacterium]|nr:hypothetical protein [Mycobacteriales bacterium]